MTAGPLGIFGGVFDPVHFGHLRTALEVRELVGMDDMRMVPCRIPPHRDAPIASPQDRAAMLRIGIRGCEGLHLDERELQREGPSYMVDTLSSIREEEGDRPLCLVLGEDSFAGLYLWHHWQQIPKLCHLVVMTRPVDPRPTPPELRGLVEEHLAEDRASLCERPAGLVLPIKVTALGISATRIRVLLHRESDARYLLPEAVLNYILEKGLYGIKSEYGQTG